MWRNFLSSLSGPNRHLTSWCVYMSFVGNVAKWHCCLSEKLLGSQSIRKSSVYIYINADTWCMHVFVIFESCHGGRKWAFKVCQQCERNPVNAAREARLAPRAADMGREEQDWLQNVDGGEKQKRCCQQRCKQLQGERQERKRLFLSRTFRSFSRVCKLGALPVYQQR